MSTAPITIRPARDVDTAALRRLAALDSSVPLTGDALVAEEGGELRAAVSVTDERAIADPFHRTADLVSLLRFSRRRLAAR
jgi:hypothetical protein